MGIILILGGILLYRSYALYEEEKEFNVLKGQIPDFGYDIKMLSVVVDGNKSKTIPERGLYKTNVECSGEKTTGTWDYNAWNLVLENVESNTKCNISFTSNLTEGEYNQYIEAGVALRRNTYRGKDITSYWKDESLYTMISNGTFDDIYVGDYIIDDNGNKWLIADLDNYLGTGNPVLAQHHATIISKNTLINAPMNNVRTTEGGYVNSKMVQEVLPSYLNTFVIPTFGSHIITYRNLLTAEVDLITMQATSTTGWIDRQIDLMSEINVYGCNIYGIGKMDIGIENRQYALFQLKPALINLDGHDYWFKDIASDTSYASVHISYANLSLATNSGVGVRPRFLIG